MKSSQTETQRQIFNKEFAHISTSDVAAWQASYLERIEKYLLRAGESKKTFLEVGSGDGKLSLHFASAGYSVTACDISDVAVLLTKQFAKQQKLKVNVEQCDVTKLPFKSASFDYIVAGAILEHLDDEEKALKEWSRVLKKGGRIFIVTPVRQRHVLPIWWGVNWFHDRRLGHVRRYDRKRYQTFEKYGLSLYKTLYTGHTPKVFLTILYILIPSKHIELLAERIDQLFIHLEFDSNNITGFFEKK